MFTPDSASRLVTVSTDGIELDGVLTMPRGHGAGLVIFAHGSGSSRLSPRNRWVAGVLERAGLSTLLFDLLTREEVAIDLATRKLRFDIGLLAKRVVGTIDWCRAQPALWDKKIGIFGASTGAAAALVAAARRPDLVHAVVSRGGRPDLAGDALEMVRAPTLLIVGGNDVAVIGLNRTARARIVAPVRLEIVPAAGHLFEEPGALDEVAMLAARFFRTHLAAPREAQPRA